ncbi:hypothetical protein [Mycolicibacterium hodleri]|uniref:hypothetical protein n=1 Tax=Mycolicibacterium hodleri TaxID=49897 RepID=UPI001F15F570|nr:hypothetical protein [Mycolicibacterium hodleri]
MLCPFTHAGLHTLIDRRSESARTEPRLRIRAWPLELINRKPLDPDPIDAEVTPPCALPCGPTSSPALD